LVSISISLTPELLAALDKLRGNEERSGYVAQLIAEKARSSDVAIEEPKVVTTADRVKQAAEGFEKAHRRPPAIVELQRETKLPYHSVWNAVRSMSIKTLDARTYRAMKGKKRSSVMVRKRSSATEHSDPTAYNSQ